MRAQLDEIERVRRLPFSAKRNHLNNVIRRQLFFLTFASPAFHYPQTATTLPQMDDFDLHTHND